MNALKNDPENKEVYNNLGVTCFQDRNQDQALDCFERALSIDPFYRDGVINFCALLKQMGCLHTAVPLLETNIRRNPEDDEIRALLQEARKCAIAEMKKQISQLYEAGDIQEAMGVAEKLIALSPDDAEGLNDYAVLCYQNARVEEARKVMDKACRMALGNPIIEENRKIIGGARGSETKTDRAPAKQTRPAGENVAVMELLYHWNYFITTVDLLKQRHNVSLILGKAFKAALEKNYRFDPSGFNPMVVEVIDWSMINRFLRENKISKLFIPTIQGFEFIHHFAGAELAAPFYFTIHNFDLWLGKRPLVTMSDKSMEQQINRVHHRCCSEIIRKSAGIISIDTSLRDTVSRMIPGKKIHVMPWNVNHRLLTLDDFPSQKKPVVFTIPASIDRMRRNYGVALETFRGLAREHDDVKLVLLGRPIDEYGKAIIERGKAINQENGREVIELFDGFIHQDIYEDRLHRTDYFILPLTNLHVFGRFKASAAMYDAMFSGRPILIPEKMQFSEDFCTRFGDGFIVYKDLKQTIEELLASRDGVQEKIRRAAIDNANYFFLENQERLINEQFFD